MPSSGVDTQFSRLQLRDWRQFDEVDIWFHPRLTVLTGANASGKTTLLGILASHFEWRWSYSASPSSNKRRRWRAARGPRFSKPNEAQQEIGLLTYSTTVVSQLQVPSDDFERMTQYQVRMTHPQPIAGMFIMSHRTVSGSYAKVDKIPTEFGSEAMFAQLTTEAQDRWLGTSRARRHPSLTLKESLIAAAVFGEGSASVEASPAAAGVWFGFQTILVSVLPKSLGFRRLRIQMPDVVVETATGDFIIDEVSGGIAAIIEMAWQIFLRSRDEGDFTVLIDEPENHLHPSLQREIIPSLLDAFPHVQFIVATHSPFVVTATPDSTVYALDFEPDRGVVSRVIDYANKATSADETLRQVLGLESIMPVWAEARFDSLVSDYAAHDFSAERLRGLREDLARLGLAGDFPAAVVEITDQIARKRPDA